mmetsp:Transcript_149835/g.480141  ORF Transcript_149835/g.480141 Transcript_149835/m.480141 type:complete len:185 (+) Transcript_149835:282-836(+)
MGVLLGGVAATWAAIATARRPAEKAGLSKERGWCITAAFLLVVSLICWALFWAANIGSHIGYFVAGLATALLTGAVVNGALMPCLALGLDRLWLIYALGVALAVAASLVATPNGALGELRWFTLRCLRAASCSGASSSARWRPPGCLPCAGAWPWSATGGGAGRDVLGKLGIMFLLVTLVAWLR